MGKVAIWIAAPVMIVGLASCTTPRFAILEWEPPEAPVAIFILTEREHGVAYFDILDLHELQGVRSRLVHLLSEDKVQYRIRGEDRLPPSGLDFIGGIPNFLSVIPDSTTAGLIVEIHIERFAYEYVDEPDSYAMLGHPGWRGALVGHCEVRAGNTGKDIWAFGFHGLSAQPLEKREAYEGALDAASQELRLGLLAAKQGTL